MAQGSTNPQTAKPLNQLRSDGETALLDEIRASEPYLRGITAAVELEEAARVSITETITKLEARIARGEPLDRDDEIALNISKWGLANIERVS